MSYIDSDDGQIKCSRSEHYEVSGEVTIKIRVRYTTKDEPGDDENDLWEAIKEIVGDDFDIVDTSDLDYDIEADDE